MGTIVVFQYLEGKMEGEFLQGPVVTGQGQMAFG